MRVPQVFPASVVIGLMLVCGVGVAPAQTLPPDVGLVTRLSGEVTYANDTDQKQPTKALAFMKVRRGDRFQVPGGGFLTLVYHANGRQEAWSGPAALQAETAESRGEGPAQPKISTLPVKVTEKMKGSPLPLPRSDLDRMGGIRTMGGTPLRGGGTDEGAKPAPALDPEAKKELAQAAKTYQQLRKKAPPDDLTPELYYLAALAEYQQYAQMGQVLADMEKRQPGSPVVKDLKSWLASQAGAGKPAPGK